MLGMIRDAGAKPVLLILPRASQVSSRYPYEDPARHLREAPLPGRSTGGEVSRDEANLLTYSCIDVGGAEDPLDALYERSPHWRVFHPEDPVVRELLTEGARAWVEGRFDAAQVIFERALARDPSSPLALYDLASTSFSRGLEEAGMQLLERADRASCNVFLRYQTGLWRVATELDVPVVDLVLHFQAHGAASLFRDPAHPSAEARDVIAGALWPVVAP